MTKARKDLPIAICFVGAEGVGKTTLARQTHDRLHRSGWNLRPMVTEVARAVGTKLELKIAAMRTDVDLVNRYQEEIFLTQFEEEQRRRFVGYVADRTLADNLCYRAEYGTDLAPMIHRHRRIIEEYLPHLRRALIFHVTPQRSIYESAAQADGVRAVVPWEGVVRIDAMLKILLKIWNVVDNVHYIQTANAAERSEQIGAVVGSWLRATPSPR